MQRKALSGYHRGTRAPRVGIDMPPRPCRCRFMVLARNQGGSPGVDGEARRAGDGEKRAAWDQAGFPAWHRPWGVVLS